MYQGSLLRIYLGQMNTAASVLMSFASPAPQFAPVHVGSLYPGEFAVDPNELLKFLQGPRGVQQQPAQAGAHDLMPDAAADGSATETTRFAGILHQAMDFTKNLLTRLSTGRRGSVEAFQGIPRRRAGAAAAADPSHPAVARLVRRQQQPPRGLWQRRRLRDVRVGRQPPAPRRGARLLASTNY